MDTIDSMTNFIAALVLLGLAIVGVVVRKTYYYLPAHELKRQAERHDRVAEQLYRAVAYGNSLRGLLWLFIALTSAGGFVLLAREAPVWLSLLAVVALLWAALSWLPASRVTRLGTKLAMLVTPAIAWLLNYLHPLVSRGADIVERRYTAPHHTGIFEREDLLQLIDDQQAQDDSRLTPEELEIARRALSFDNYIVGDILTPRGQVKTVLAGDTVGPVLIDELHQRGQPYVLVRDSAKGPFVGTLAIRQLGLQSTGEVRDVMDATVYYVHENDVLSEALHAFFSTNHPLFVVVNSSEEYVGIITVENILHQLLGHIPGDDFDQYTDITAVAARHPKIKKLKKAEPEATKTDEEMVK